MGLFIYPAARKAAEIAFRALLPTFRKSTPLFGDYRACLVRWARQNNGATTIDSFRKLQPSTINRGSVVVLLPVMRSLRCVNVEQTFFYSCGSKAKLTVKGEISILGPVERSNSSYEDSRSTKSKDFGTSL